MHLNVVSGTVVSGTHESHGKFWGPVDCGEEDQGPMSEGWLCKLLELDSNGKCRLYSFE